MSPPQARSPLNRERVIQAALVVVDRDGLDGLTMRALGRELGSDPMAPYHHLPNKAAVLDGVAEAVWSELELPDDHDQPWQTRLEQVAGAVRDTLRRHPNALPILASRPNLSAPGFRLTDHTLGILLEAGFPADEALAFVNAAGEFLLGHALAESAPALPGAADDDILAAADTFQTTEAFPHLAQVLDTVDLSTVTMDRIFEAGLATLRRGLERRLDELHGD
jgi:TetR/AcrR family transcriptional regulator, tetracycline repressor protein